MVNFEGLAHLAVMGLVMVLLLVGAVGGFALASVINLGKLCL
jgi:hypothetical protein